MYILKCSDGSYYVGSTWDLKRRLIQHNEGRGANYTSEKLPVEIVYKEKFNRIEDAYERERQIHKWTRKKKEALINSKQNNLKKYSKKDFSKRLSPTE